MEKIKFKTYSETMSGDTETPITLYSKYVKNNIGFMLESKEQPKGRYTFLSTNPFLTIKAYKDNVEIINNGKGKKEEKKGKALEIVKEEIEKYEIINNTSIPFVGGAVGSVGYDMIKQYEKLPNENMDTVNVPDLHLLFVKEVIAYDHFFNTINIIVLEDETDEGEEQAKERIREIITTLKKDVIIEDENSEELIFQSNTTKTKFEEAVNKAKEYIYNGDIFQVVLSQRWSARTNTNPFILYRKLRRVNPSPYMFYFNFNEYYIAGSSPEMLVEIMDNRIFNCPIAGTRRRGKDEEEDQILAKDLLNDEKERAEHIMLVDLGRNDMGKVSKIGTVEVTKYMEVQNYSHVMHLVSLVEGEKREDKDMFETLMSFLPAGTLSGAPKIRAMEIIEELEISKRGIYGGAIGYFGFNGNMDMCIAIRTMVIKDNIVHIQAGAGIVADSDPLKEYEETENKAQALITAINS